MKLVDALRRDSGRRRRPPRGAGYAGQTVGIVDRATGEVRQTQVFIAVLGASNYTLADAILDRLVDNAYRLNLKGESMRKTKLNLTTTGLSE